MVGHPPQRSGPPPGGQALAGRAGERVAKALARAGVASRRQVERLIEAGRITLNGEVLTSPAVKVGPGDILAIDGQRVQAAEPTRLFRYHKPVGLLTTHSDPRGRRTVFEALPPGLPRLISVGRLDITSEGLLLLTNDGALARALELPSSGWKRRYRARARGRIDQARLDQLKDGITVEGIRYGAIEAALDRPREGPQGANLWLRLSLAEGKNREVRRVLEALGLTVNRLIRIAYGPFTLGDLQPGEVEEVSPRQIREELARVIPPANLPKDEGAPLPAPPRKSATRAPSRPGTKPGPAPKSAETKTYKTGWARPKIRPRLKSPGSAPAVARSAGPRGRRPSSSPRRSSPAHRPDLPPEGGPKPGE
ncbi:MAG TPA: pseudouridine synthase [Caulobacteraceae bacterium]